MDATGQENGNKSVRNLQRRKLTKKKKQKKEIEKMKDQAFISLIITD